MNKVRTRYAPSPTGFLHVGNVRTAFFAWLVAKQNNGQYILRIEDTDKAREVSGAEKHIIDSLNWLGVTWNEGTDVGGPYAPYRQSERLDIYHKWAKKLVTCGKAYADPYTQVELNSFREKSKTQKKPFLFRDYRPQNPPEWNGTQPLRLKSEPKKFSWTDLVMGKLSTGPEVIDDFILIKPDGYPTYNFGHIVDDHLMNISHVIRGQEFISSMPKFLSLYEALSFETPKFAHLPYVMAIDGKKKLGKRDGAKDILAYARDGYLPEAMMNFLATLGWNDGSEQEIFSQEELIRKFSLDRVQRSGARFDEQRLLWMNGSWIRRLNIDDLHSRCQNFWPDSAKEFTVKYQKQVLLLIQDRLKFLAELPDLTSFFFSEPVPNIDLIINNKTLGNRPRPILLGWLKQALDSLEESDFTTTDVNTKLNALLVKTSTKPAELFSLIRISTTWAPFSPNLSESLCVLGKEKTLGRLKKSLEFLS